MYEVDGDLLMVASDRISAYDVILPDPIPDKGAVLTQMSVFWFEHLGDVCPNHFLSLDVPEEVAGRAIRVRRLDMYPVECVVRGYLSGSGWREYRESGAVCGIELPEGLQESDKLPEPIFTPATKAELGEHDENVDFERAVEIVGDRALMEHLRDASIELYTPGLGPRRGAGDHPRRHEVRVRLAPGRRGGPRRRGPHPRLLPLLARRRVRAGPAAALVRQAVRARLPRLHGLGPHPTGAGAPRRGDPTTHARATWRRTSASPTASSPHRAPRPREHLHPGDASFGNDDPLRRAPRRPRASLLLRAASRAGRDRGRRLRRPRGRRLRRDPRAARAVPARALPRHPG